MSRPVRHRRQDRLDRKGEFYVRAGRSSRPDASSVEERNSSWVWCESMGSTIGKPRKAVKPEFRQQAARIVFFRQTAVWPKHGADILQAAARDLLSMQ